MALILDGGTNYGAYKVISGFNDYALVTATGTFLGTNSIKAMLADGSTDSYTNVEAADGGIDYSNVDTAVDTDNDGEPDVPQLYAYELRSNGDNIALNRSAATYESATDAVTGGDSKVTHRYVADNMTLRVLDDSADTLDVVEIVSADAVVFLNNGTKWQVYTAADLSSFSFTDNSLLQYFVKSGKVVAIAGYVGSFPTANSSNTAYGYVTGYISTEVDDSPVTELTIWNGTEDVTLLVDGTATANKGDFVRYPIVADGAVVANSDIDLEGSITWLYLCRRQGQEL